MEIELNQTIKVPGGKLDAIWKSVEKTRKYFLVIIWVTVILFVLPLAGLVFIIPQFLDVYLGSFNGLL